MSEEVQVNKHCVNRKITYTVHPPKRMVEIGFRLVRDDRFWYYCKSVADDITINVTIPVDSTDQDELDICVLDEQFCQPYDYQRFLDPSRLTESDMSQNWYKFATGVRDNVEREMAYLQEQGVLHGHVPGEYI